MSITSLGPPFASTTLTPKDAPSGEDASAVADFAHLANDGASEFQSLLNSLSETNASNGEPESLEKERMGFVRSEDKSGARGKDTTPGGSIAVGSSDLGQNGHMTPTMIDFTIFARADAIERAPPCSQTTLQIETCASAMYPSDQTAQQLKADERLQGVDRRNAAFPDRNVAELPELARSNSAISGRSTERVQTAAESRDVTVNWKEDEEAGKTTVRSLVSHFTTMAADLFSQQNRAGSNGVASIVASAPTSSLREAAPKLGDGIARILTIELTPESLGCLTAKIRIFGRSVSLELDVSTREAKAALESSSSKLIEAIQSAGCKVDSCEIKISPTPASTDNLMAASQMGRDVVDNNTFASTGGTKLDNYGPWGDRRNDGRDEDRRSSRRDSSLDAPAVADAHLISGVYL